MTNLLERKKELELSIAKMNEELESVNKLIKEEENNTVSKMVKHLKATEILLPRSNKAKCPIYKFEDKFYIKANKPNTSSYRPFYYQGEEYTEVYEGLHGRWMKN